MTGKYLINNLKKKDREKGITLICTFSRQVLVKIFFKALDNMDLPRKDMHLLVYDNTEDIGLTESLKEEINNRLTDYLSVRLYKSYLKGKGSIAGSGNEQFKKSKLFNIWSMWKQLYVNHGGMIYTPEFFQLEDDTIAPPDAYKRLTKTFYKKPNSAMVIGIETGRGAVPWNPVRLGVHMCKVENNTFLWRHSLSPFTRGIKKVDCCGVYCFIVDTKIFHDAFDEYDPGKMKIPFFGMDNYLTWKITNAGYDILADFNVWCSHLQCSAGRIIAFSKDQAVEMYDKWLPECNNYCQGVEVKKLNQRSRRYQVRKQAFTIEL